MARCIGDLTAVLPFTETNSTLRPLMVELRHGGAAITGNRSLPLREGARRP